MAYLILALLLTGLLGMLGATVLPPLIAALLIHRRSSSGTPQTVPEGSLSLQVLVTAYNEEATISATLGSIAEALRYNTVSGSAIIVGLDHCTDRTEEIVRAFALNAPCPVSCQPKRGPAGKWRMMVELARASEAEWLAFVDCGSIWEPSLLSAAESYLRLPDVQIVAPSYLPQRPGMLERVNWRLEQTIKRLENWSGGPISVHGATVLYRRVALLEVFNRLEGHDFLNDDLVIPSMLRLIYPTRRVAYLSFADPSRAYVIDNGVKPEVAVEYRRRRRILHGSVQWLQLIAAQGGLRQPVFAVLATRRLSRMLWSYWISCIVTAGILFVATYASFGILILVFTTAATLTLIASSNFVRRLAMAYIVTLGTPFLIFHHMSRHQPKAVKWE